MAKKLKPLATRLVIVVVIVHTVLLPLLFRGLLYIVEESHKQMFVDNVRTFSRFVADHVEEELSEHNSIKLLLDSLPLSSHCVLSQLWEDNKLLYQSSLNNPLLTFTEDFAFGEHEDNIYFLSVALLIPERQVILRLGFDEQPTITKINQAYRTGILVLSGYFLLSLVGVIWMSLRLTKPLRFLQKSSRIIASGHFSDRLSVDSKILEIDELAKDLEFMRSELFQTNQELQQEILQRHAEEKRRKLLEAQLLHSQKLEMIGTLAGGIAHEFNNILVPIVLYTELARDELPEQSPIANDLDRVINSAERAKALVQQILTFSRQEHDHQLKPIDLASIITEALQLLRAITPASIDYRQHIDEFDGLVLGDEG
jgi:C4-dicarboxylate-specific signal transduction histidine kinase